MKEQEFLLFKNFISEEFGLSLNNHNSESLAKKLKPRLSTLGLTSFGEYYNYLTTHPASKNELQELSPLIINSESYFLREYAQFVLLLELITAMKTSKTKKPANPIRVLSAGCAAGQEPYSICMMLKNNSDALPAKDFHILGIDINQKALSSASQGIYRTYAFRGSNGKLIEKYFTQVDLEHYKIDTKIIKNVELKHGNILKSSVFKKTIKFDFIFCRNLLMYMSKKAQDTIAANLWGALADHGYLFLGQTESFRKQHILFEPVNYPGVTVYQKKTDSAKN